MRLVVGIDVGGIRKGFHLAALDLANQKIFRLGAAATPLVARQWIEDLPTAPECIAIDAPPFALRTRDETRTAEQEVCRAGYRVQWTRKAPMVAAEWMEHGAALWLALIDYPRVETFPTVVHDQLSGENFDLPLQLLMGCDRKFYKDLMDACICCVAAARFLRGDATCFGKDDEFGPIWC